ncbi:hypothetical protein PINS_up002984 [Pythium insidiosum]|nr:hypothetical protein PINS_up002984 [Pythium insidiosum]
MEFWCIDCDLSFCVECFDAIHDDVSRARPHRRVSMQGTPGTLFIRSKWSTRFLEAVNALRKHDPVTADVPLPTQLEHGSISELGVETAEFAQKTEAKEERIQPTNMNADPLAATSPSVGDKRKRDEVPAEIICLDDDSDDARETTTLVPLGTVGETGFSGPPPATSEAVPLAGEMPRLTIPEPTVYPPPRASTPSTPSGFVGTSQSFNGPTTFSTPSTRQFGMHTSLTPRYSDSNNQHGNMPMSAPMMTQASNALPPASMPMSNGHPLPTPQASAVIAGLVDNPLEEAMYEQLDRVNSSITQTEQAIVQLNAQIVQASYHNIQAAQKLVAQLQEQQVRLEQLKSRRDLAVVHLIIQSKSIIAKVKMLRVDLLGDIPQVQVASFQKCSHASAQLQLATATFATLNSRMALTLETMGSVSTEVFHRSVSSINDAIQKSERLVTSLKLERENEIVRVVQYSARIRDMLKRAVTLHQRQRQQHHQVRRQQQSHQHHQQQQQQQHQPQQARATHQASDPRRSSQQTTSQDFSQEINQLFDQLNNSRNQQQ